MALARAYLDTFSGLVPCVVECVTLRGGMQRVVHVRLTATRGAYRRGECLEFLPRYVLPRSCIHVRCGQYRVWAHDPWEVSP